MKSNIEALGIFHDGSITEIKGDLPDISLRVEISYLRDMFPGEGDSIWIQFGDCKYFSFLSWETDKSTFDLKAIEKEELEILSVEEEKDIAKITCSTGVLKIEYSEISFKLDSGVVVELTELSDTCERYWDEWEIKKSS